MDLDYHQIGLVMNEIKCFILIEKHIEIVRETLQLYDALLTDYKDMLVIKNIVYAS